MFTPTDTVNSLHVPSPQLLGFRTPRAVERWLHAHGGDEHQPRRRADRPDPLPATRTRELVLYVSAGSLASARAEATLQRLLAAAPSGELSLRIVDVAQHVDLAERDRVLYTPTLICRHPRGDVRVLGDLSDARVLIEVLADLRIAPA